MSRNSGNSGSNSINRNLLSKVPVTKSEIENPKPIRICVVRTLVKCINLREFLKIHFTGRLVVSDGVFYARQDLKANIIVDMCTLTGAQGISTGRTHAAHLTNDETMEDLVRAVGKGRIHL